MVVSRDFVASHDAVETVICAPLYGKGLGLRTEVVVGPPDGLPADSARWRPRFSWIDREETEPRGIPNRLMLTIHRSEAILLLVINRSADARTA